MQPGPVPTAATINTVSVRQMNVGKSVKLRTPGADTMAETFMSGVSRVYAARHIRSRWLQPCRYWTLTAPEVLSATNEPMDPCEIGSRDGFEPSINGLTEMTAAIGISGVTPLRSGWWSTGVDARFQQKVAL